jgi:hypothetical protein
MLCIHKDNVVYLPVPKNASTMYVNLFFNNGWKKDEIENVDTKDKILFGHIQNPHIRHTKGLTEFLQKNKIYNLDIESKYHNILVSSLPDIHTYPITTIYKKYYECATWIPIDSKIPSNLLTSAFLQKNGINLKIPVEMKKHVTLSKRFKIMVEEINRVKIDNLVYKEFEEQILKKDMELYNNSLKII